MYRSFTRSCCTLAVLALAACADQPTPVSVDAPSASPQLTVSSVTISGPTSYSTSGGTYTWTTSVSGTGSYTYQWQERMLWADGYQEPWQDISGATGSSFTRTVGTYTVDTEYRVLVTSGNTASDTHTVSGSCNQNNTCPG